MGLGDDDVGKVDLKPEHEAFLKSMTEEEALYHLNNGFPELGFPVIKKPVEKVSSQRRNSAICTKFALYFVLRPPSGL